MQALKINSNDRRAADNVQAYTLPAFMAAFGIGKTKVWAEIKARRLNAVRCGRKVIIRAADAETWVSSLPPVTGKAKPARS